MNFVELHKFDGFSEFYFDEDNKKGESIIINLDYVKRIYTSSEWRNGEPVGSITHIVDDRGNDIMVAESYRKVKSMMFGEEKDDE